VIHDRAVNRTKHAIRNVAWSGNLQEVTASMNGNLQAVRGYDERLYSSKSVSTDFARENGPCAPYLLLQSILHRATFELKTILISV
jgi:hypothetical protein